MKVKLKLNTANLKTLFFEHVEKLGAVVAIVLLGVFILSALGRDTLPAALQPKQVMDRSETASHKVESNQPPAFPAPQDYKALAKNTIEGVHPETYYLATTLNEPVFREPDKRADPQLFTVLDLQATPFRGALAFLKVEGADAAPHPLHAPAPAATPAHPHTPASPAGTLTAGNNAQPAGPRPIPGDFSIPGPQTDGSPEAVDGVIVTGVIPEEVQIEEFVQRFKNARKPNSTISDDDRVAKEAEKLRDVPQYIWCRVERTDLSDGSVKVLEFGDLLAVRGDQKVLGQDLINLTVSPEVFQYFRDAKRRWATKVDEIVDPKYLAASWLSWPLPPIYLRDWGTEASHPKIPLVSQAPEAAAEQPKTDDAPDDLSAGGKTPGVGRPAVSAGAGAHSGEEAKAVPVRLFRFVDLNVEAGRSYQYRVQLVLRNPNYGLPRQVLANPDDKSLPYRDTPWSEKSQSVALPLDTKLLAAHAPRTTRHADTGYGLSILAWDKKDGLELLKDAELDLGGVANFPRDTVKDVVDPSKREIRDVSFDFKTDAVLLDARGGEAGPDKQDPNELLLLERGRLIVLNDGRDKSLRADWERLHKVPEELQNPATPGAGTPGAGPSTSSGGGNLLHGGDKASGPSSTRPPKTK